MPFKSEKQKRFMYAKHPGIAEKWTREMKAKGRATMQKKKRKIK